MKRNFFFAFLIIINILLINLFLIQYTNASYPMVGNDYAGFTARLIDSHLYYKANGLGIEWYTPNFGGGLPAYPNPVQTQFSLPQLVTWFANPYLAILISTSIYVAIGFLVTYLFLNRVFELRPLSAILGADFFLINGFMIERVVVGHVNLLTFPLIIIPLFAMLHPKLPSWIGGVLISITGAALVYSGGVYIAIIGLFSTLIIFPLIFFLKPQLLSWRKILPVLIWGAVLTALLCGSKLYATMQYMRFFSREVSDHYPTNWLTGLGGMIFQLFGTMNFLPILSLIHKTSASFTVRLLNWTKTPYGFWELDASIAPGLVIMLVMGVIMVIFRKPRSEIRKVTIKKMIAGLCLIFIISLVAEFSMAKGILYELFRQLPILKSLHADVRFTSAFILPLAILGAKVFDVWTGKWKSIVKVFLAFSIIGGISLASMWSYFLMPLNIQTRYFDVTSIFETYKLGSEGNIFPVTQIVPDMNDYEVFFLGSSNTRHHNDALFRDDNILLTPLVHEGSVFDVQNGYFNMTNPASLVFPEINGATFFERIPVSDYWKLVDFVNRRPSDWKLPLTQIVLDWAAGLTILIETCTVLAYGAYIAKKQIPFIKNLHLLPSFRRSPS
jgi:hypothetical protein